jgi:vitamin B12 transporter
LRVAGDFTFFGRQVDQLIAFQPGNTTLTAFNVGQARVLGTELSLDLTLAELLRVTLSYTFLDPRDRTPGAATYDRVLPNRAAHQVTLRVEARRGPFRVYYDLDFVDDTFRDPANDNRIPKHTLHGLGAGFQRDFFALDLEARNLADLRVVDLPLGGSANQGMTAPYPLVDVYNYPLPGRALYATLTLHR